MNKISGELEVMDLLSLVSFYFQMKNYESNIDQNALQATINSAVDNIHEHLEIQDKKIDEILEKIGGVNIE